MLYFAYGSNLLTARIAARCPSVRPVDVTRAEGYVLDFSKPSIDGSGKATLTRSETETVHGVLYEIDESDLPALDRAENGYDRIDEFAIAGRYEHAITYIAEKPQSGLAPYDWYLALVIAGAREHGLDINYVTSLLARPHTEDIRRDCVFRTHAHQALQLSGHHSVQDALG